MASITPKRTRDRAIVMETMRQILADIDLDSLDIDYVEITHTGSGGIKVSLIARPPYAEGCGGVIGG